jgi:hypothetical protein
VLPQLMAAHLNLAAPWFEAQAIQPAWLQHSACACAGWEKPWVEQIVDRIMKNMLRTTEERAAAVVSGFGAVRLSGVM